MNGTWKAIIGCGLTLLLLAGVVTYLETRLPSEVKRAIHEDEALAREDLAGLKTLQNQILAELRVHGDLLGETARAEHWEDLINLAVEDLEQVTKAYDGELAQILDRNSREDEDRAFELLKQLFDKRADALKSVEHLPARVKELAEILPRAASTRDAFVKALAADHKAIKGMLEGMTALEAKVPDVEPILARELWVQQLEKADKGLDELDAKLAELQPKVDTHTVAAAKEVILTVGTLDASRSRTMGPAQRVQERFQALKTYLDKRESYKQQLAGDLKAIEALPFAKSLENADALAKRYAFNATEIQRRKAAIETFLAYAKRTAESGLEEIRKPLSQANPGHVNKCVVQVQKRRGQASKVLSSFDEQLLDLDRSYEKILADMEIKEGYEVTFHQEFLEVTAVHGQRAAQEKRAWVNVKEADYKKYEALLGMAIAYKPFGYFKDQTERKQPSPAGVAYVGNPAYGSWQGDHWAFGDDPLTKSLVVVAWRGHYPKHSRADQSAYDQRRVPWFGTDRWGHAQYGSKGNLTRLIYASSRYVRNNGWATTKYKRTGGKYRGTRYEQRRTTTTVFVGGSRSSGSSSSRTYRSSSSSRTSYRTSSGK